MPIYSKGEDTYEKIMGYKTTDWDDPIPEVQQKDWEIFFKEMHMIKYLNFPGSIKPQDAVWKPDLAIFSDSSKGAYGAVAYARWKKCYGNYESRLMFPKNRIARVEVVGIARL